MKNKFILIILLLIVSNVNAQDYRKYWADGDLTWNDFQAKPIKNYTSHLAYVLLYQTNKKIINNKTYYGVFSDAYVDKSLSFVHKNIQDNYHLKYNQVIFNLVEIQKRELQKRFYNLDNIFEANALLSDAKSQLDRKVLDFQEECNYGIQRNITDNWLAETTKILNSKSALELPDFKKSNWSYGMYGGLDFNIQGNKYKEIFNNTIGVSLGFEFSYKKIFMGLNMSFSSSKLKQDLIDNSLTIPKGEKSSIGLLNTYFGYPIFETEKVRITPFIGYGVGFLSEIGNQDNKEEISAGTSIFGFNFDLKNKKTVNFTPSIFNLREEGNTYFRAKIFLSNSNFNSNLKGYTLNIGLAYGFEAKSLSKK